MLKSLLVAAALTAALAAPAQAQIVARSSDGFALQYAEGVQVATMDLPGSLAAIARWWSDDHTYSGEAANLSLVVEPGGCWCEALPDGEIFRHARVISVKDDEVVLDAPLGPLNGQATKATLTVVLTMTERGPLPLWTFEVEGPGTGAFAEGVDAVMSEAYASWVAYLASGY